LCARDEYLVKIDNFRRHHNSEVHCLSLFCIYTLHDNTMWYHNFGQFFAFASLSVFWSLALYNSWPVWNANLVTEKLSDPTLTSLVFSTSNINSKLPHYVIDTSVVGGVFPIIHNHSHKALGYIPAPIGSIILNAKAHGAIYSLPIPRLTILYQPVPGEPVLWIHRIFVSTIF